MTVRRLSLAFTLTLAACGSDPPAAPAAPRGVTTRTPSPAPAAPAEGSYLDAQGKLKPGATAFVGMQIPVTYEARGCHDGLCAFVSTEVPVGPLRAYVTERVETATIEELGQGAMFRFARVKGAEPADRHADVEVVATGRGSTLLILDIPPFDPARVDTRARLEEVRREFAAEQD